MIYCNRVSRTRYCYDPFGRRQAKRHEPDLHAEVQAPSETRYYGWDGDRLVREEDSDSFTRIVYAPGSFTPLLRLTRPKAGQLPIARAYAEIVSGDDPALAARVMAELEQLPDAQQQALLMGLIAGLIQAPDNPAPVGLHSGEGEIDDDTLPQIKRRIEQAESERPVRNILPL